MRRYLGFAGSVIILSFLSLVYPVKVGSTDLPSTVLSDVRYWPYEEYTRIVFDLNQPITYYDKYLPNPDRVYVDLHETFVAGTIPPIMIGGGLVKLIRTGQHDKQTVRVVLELTGQADYKIYPLSSPDRLVLDIFKESSASDIRKARISERSSPVQTIVIDPGHGGKDPGASGKSGLKEKDIVLDVGLRLESLVKKRLGANVIMTRKDDQFIPLDERTTIANNKEADLFVSIHTNASRKTDVRGVETYLLGKATDKNAMETAMRENMTSKTSSDSLKLILTDLLMTAKKDESFRLAHYVQGNIIDRLETRYKAVDLGVKQAPFYVLVNARMPSILAEISFISNPQEAKLLATDEYRQEIAEAIYEGIKRYLQATPMLTQPQEVTYR